MPPDLWKRLTPQSFNTTPGPRPCRPGPSIRFRSIRLTLSGERSIIERPFAVNRSGKRRRSSCRVTTEDTLHNSRFQDAVIGWRAEGAFGGGDLGGAPSRHIPMPMGAWPRKADDAVSGRDRARFGDGGRVCGEVQGDGREGTRATAGRMRTDQRLAATRSSSNSLISENVLTTSAVWISAAS